MSLSTLAACCAVGLLSHPFNSFTILSWNQPASFVATFARRKIESVLDFFQKELPQNDSYNTRDYYWFHASMRAVGFGMVYRGILMWSCTGAMSLNPVIPSWLTSCFRFVKSKLVSSNSSSSSSAQNRIDEEESTTSMTKTSNNNNNKQRIHYAPDRILGYTVSYSTGIIVRSTFRSLTSGLATFLATPLQIVLIIFVADISGGYPDLKRAWMGLKASCFCDWERDHPHYQPGDNPWQLKKRPHLVKMMWNKLSKLEVLERAVLPFVKYAMLHSIVSSAVQYSEAWFQMKSRSHRYDDKDSSNNTSDEPKKEEEEEADNKEECEEDQNDIVSIIQSKKLTPVQKIKKIFSICTRASRIFVVASVAHGLVSYNMSQVLSTAVQNFCRMTDYAQPYQAAGGLSSIADPMVMRVPKISLFFGISDGIFWGMITTLVTMWR